MTEHSIVDATTVARAASTQNWTVGLATGFAEDNGVRAAWLGTGLDTADTYTNYLTLYSRIPVNRGSQPSEIGFRVKIRATGGTAVLAIDDARIIKDGAVEGNDLVSTNQTLTSNWQWIRIAPATFSSLSATVTDDDTDDTDFGIGISVRCTSSGTAATPEVDAASILLEQTPAFFKGAKAHSYEDMRNGAHCSVTGHWNPASNTVWVQGKPYQKGYEKDWSETKPG